MSPDCQATGTIAHSAPPRGLTRPWQLGLLLGVGALLLSFDWGVRVLGTNDEARYPMLARDIFARGDWLYPQLNGITHLNKAPLYAWLVVLASWPGDAVTQRSAAFPSILAALGVVAVTYWLGLRLFDSRVALIAGLTVLTTHGVLSLGRVSMPDMTFCLAFTGAMAAFVAFEIDGRRGRLVAFYLLTAAAFWAKGPAALLVLVVGIVYTLSTHGRRGLGRLQLGPGCVLLALLTAPWWLVGAVVAQGSSSTDVVVYDWLLWYLPTSLPTWRTLSDPFNLTLEILLPWSVLLLPALWVVARTQTGRFRFPLIWLAAVFLMIGLGQQQRMRYYLPLCPPAALLIAIWWSRLALRPALHAGAWASLAIGLIVWQVHDDRDYNAEIDLSRMTVEVGETPKSLYTLKVPELVLGFYLERPVALLKDVRHLQSLVADGTDAYFLLRDKEFPASALPVDLQRTGDGRVKGERFGIFTRP
jgi:4-amino-4-deoxy-L-arabinose transferase-like glycosyltransferase